MQQEQGSRGRNAGRASWIACYGCPHLGPTAWFKLFGAGSSCRISGPAVTIVPSKHSSIRILYDSTLQSRMHRETYRSRPSRVYSYRYTVLLTVTPYHQPDPPKTMMNVPTQYRSVLWTLHPINGVGNPGEQPVTRQHRGGRRCWAAQKGSTASCSAIESLIALQKPSARRRSRPWVA